MEEQEPIEKLEKRWQQFAEQVRACWRRTEEQKKVGKEKFESFLSCWKTK